MAGRSVTYHDYLQLDKLLSCQRPPSFESTDNDDQRELIHHEEQLFIVMHQTIELWFGMAISDLELARDLIGRPSSDDKQVPEEDIPKVCTLLERNSELFKLLTSQFTIIETMAPLNFLKFRDQLIPASGFQSWQFREVEVLAGLAEGERINFEGKPYFSEMPEEHRNKVAKRVTELSLRDAVNHWLARTPVEAAFPGFVETFLEAHNGYIDEQIEHQKANPHLGEEQLGKIIARFEKAKKDARSYFCDGDLITQQARSAMVFISTYRHEPLLRWPYALVTRALEFEEHFRVFRFRHARMVERMIGLRVGSGGSSGVAYLDSTASRYRIFGDLLTSVSYLVDGSRLPDEAPNAEILRFKFDSQ